MAYEFAENEFELDPLAASARGGSPPRKFTGIGVLDPPIQPRRPPDPIPATPASLLLRILGGVILAGIGVALFLLLFAR